MSDNVDIGARAARLVAGATAAFVIALATPCVGQSAPTPAFEVADVRASAPRMNPNAPMSGGAIRNGVYELRHATMLDLIKTAYNVESDKVLGGPSWLEVDRYDVVARTHPSATPDTARLMLQGLLADRFKLAARQDQREMTTWVLSQASGGAKLLRAQGAGVAPFCRPQPEQPNVKLVCGSMTIAAFIERLPRIARSYMSGTITDASGLTGPWDFEMVFTLDRAQLADLGAQGISVFDALEKQLGLKLENKTIKTTSLVVESVSRTPSANAPDVEKLLPPRPAPEFEVAELKATAPGNTRQRAQLLPTGVMNASAVPLRQLINIAWGLNSDELLAGPNWIDSARFDVVGRVFSGADAQFVDIDFVRLALQKLLVDRLQIKSHYEQRPVNAYALMTGKVKMAKADPSARTRCYPGVPPGVKDPRQENPTRGVVLTCQNVTMKYFAERLRAIAPGYIQAPIADMTALEGGWDFTLNWSAIDMFPGGVDGITARGGGRSDTGPAGADGGPGGLAAASIPTGAITLPEAVERQLGLKLQMGKRPVPVLVIDQISEKPVGN